MRKPVLCHIMQTTKTQKPRRQVFSDSEPLNSNVLIAQFIIEKNTCCRNISLYTFLANMALAERIDESADDITAAETDPRPMKVTTAGVRY